MNINNGNGKDDHGDNVLNNSNSNKLNFQCLDYYDYLD